MASMILSGDTSGTVTLSAPLVAGSNTATLPAQTGTLQMLGQGTTVATTSGTSVDFTGIPSWVKRITVMFNGVSTSGTSVVQVQVGSTTVSTSGYAANYGNTTSSSIATLAITTGFGLNANSAANDLRSGIMTLALIGSNTWVANSLVGITNTTNTGFGGGVSPALSGTLDRIRLTTVNGTDTFDAGSVNILYEG